ncbi:MAG: hypothetical protein ACR2JM_09690 [Mycobacterium sp.]
MAHTRPFLITGAALASAAAIAAVPAIASNGMVVAGAPTPAALSHAQYELTALTDISIQGVLDAFSTGWGGNLGPSDPFYPTTFNNDVTVSGIAGAAYYVLDQSGFVPFNLEDYFFEAGGLPAVAYVGVGSIFGAGSIPAQLAKVLLAGGSLDLGGLNLGSLDLGSIVSSLTAGIPIVGDLASVYFTGQIAGDTTVYGTGLAGVLAYANTKLPGISNLLNGFGIGGDSESDSEDSSNDANESDHSNGSSSHDESTEVEDTEDTPDTEDGEDSEDVNEHGNASRQAAAAAAVAVSAPVVEAPVAETPAVAEVAVEAPAEAVTGDAPAAAPSAPVRSTHRSGGPRDASGSHTTTRASRAAS